MGCDTRFSEFLLFPCYFAIEITSSIFLPSNCYFVFAVSLASRFWIRDILFLFDVVQMSFIRTLQMLILVLCLGLLTPFVTTAEPSVWVSISSAFPCALYQVIRISG